MGNNSLLLCLAQLVLRWVLNDVAIEAQPRVHLTDKAACLALEQDVLPLQLHHRLGVAARVALHVPASQYAGRKLVTRQAGCQPR